MRDQIEKKTRLVEVCNSFRQHPKAEFLETVLRRTAYIPLKQFNECCKQIEDTADGMPYNIGKTILQHYANIKPERTARYAPCVICDNAGLIIEYLFEPYLEWATPCKCSAGTKYAWMEEKMDRGFVKHLESRGVRFKQRVTPVESDDYNDF